MGIGKQRKPNKGDKITFVENGSVYQVEAVTKFHVFLTYDRWDGRIGLQTMTRRRFRKLDPLWIS